MVGNYKHFFDRAVVDCLSRRGWHNCRVLLVLINVGNGRDYEITQLVVAWL